MPTNPNIDSFLNSYKGGCLLESEKMSGGKHYFLVFPSQLSTDEAGFVQSAADSYRDVLSKEGMDQDPRKMIMEGNSYYFIRSLAKAHRMYKRGRMTNACISLSDAKGVSDGKFIDNIKQLGTVDLNPVMGGAKSK